MAQPFRTAVVCFGRNLPFTSRHSFAGSVPLVEPPSVELVHFDYDHREKRTFALARGQSSRVKLERADRHVGVEFDDDLMSSDQVASPGK